MVACVFQSNRAQKLCQRGCESPWEPQGRLSKWTAYIVTHNRCINSTGLPGHAKAIDMALEHNNLIIKKNAMRSAGANVNDHHLSVISLAASVLHEAALVLDREVHSPFSSIHHTHYHWSKTGYHCNDSSTKQRASDRQNKLVVDCYRRERSSVYPLRQDHTEMGT